MPRRLFLQTLRGVASVCLHLLPTTTAAMTITATREASRDVRDDFVGRGQIHVLNSTSFATASPADRIGCLDARGMLVGADCAVFERADDPPHTLSTHRGSCSFRNLDMPTNRDSLYGRTSHAWSCGPFPPPSPPEGREGGAVEKYYTIDGFRYPFICNGNINCFYDVYATTPGEDTGALPVWQFFWGGDQTGPPAGHSQVLWLWVPEGKGW